MSRRLTKVKKAAPAAMEEASIQFINWKKANDLSEQTILDYTTHFNLFFKQFPNVTQCYELLDTKSFWRKD